MIYPHEVSQVCGEWKQEASEKNIEVEDLAQHMKEINAQIKKQLEESNARYILISTKGRRLTLRVSYS